MEEKIPKENQTVNQLIGCQDEPTILNSTAPKIKIPEFQTEEQYLAEYDLKSSLLAFTYCGGGTTQFIKKYFKLFLIINDNCFDDSQINRIYKFLDDIENSSHEEINYFVKKIIKEVKQKQKEEYEKPLNTEEVENILIKHKNIFIKREGMEIFIKILVDYKFKSFDDKFYLQTTKKQSILTIISIFEFLYNKNFVGNFYKKLDKGKKKVDSENKNLYRRKWKNIITLFKYDSNNDFKIYEFNNYYQLYSDNQTFYCEILKDLEKKYETTY